MPYERKIFHRDEKCLNCDYPIVGDFCGKCGQKAHIHKDSSWHMLLHFIADYFHYDNKFWRTIKILFSKPGQITIDYIKGKRARYLNPIQLYIFVTTVFFILFFYSFSKEDGLSNLVKIKRTDTVVDSVTVTAHSINAGLDSLVSVNKDSLKSIEVKDIKPKYLTKYLADQKKLAPNLRDGKVKSYFLTHLYDGLQKTNEKDNYKEKMKDMFMHNIPKMLFFLMPIFAFLLYLTYVNYKIYYVDQLIFSLHFHSMIFLIYTLSFFINIPLALIDLDTAFDVLVLFGLLLYLYKSMRRVFPSSRWKTILKFFLIICSYLFVCFIVFLITALLTVMYI
jgi:hypothetical protein